jgi:hypothetical protein
LLEPLSFAWTIHTSTKVWTRQNLPLLPLKQRHALVGALVIRMDHTHKHKGLDEVKLTSPSSVTASCPCWSPCHSHGPYTQAQRFGRGKTYLSFLCNSVMPLLEPLSFAAFFLASSCCFFWFFSRASSLWFPPAAEKVS